jgi:hypothetical protein
MTQTGQKYRNSQLASEVAAQMTSTITDVLAQARQLCPSSQPQCWFGVQAPVGAGVAAGRGAGVRDRETKGRSAVSSASSP